MIIGGRARWNVGVGGTRALAAAIATVCMAIALGTTPAQAGGVGARFGYADVSDDVFTGSGDLGSTNLVGLQLVLDFFPMLEVEAAGEYVKEEFDFSEGLFEGIEAAGDGEYEDMGLFLTGRLKLLTMAFLPIQGYAGGGLNVHWVDLTITNPTVVDQGGSGDEGELEKAIEKVAGDSSEAGWHAVLGARLSLPGLPLSAFLEGRYAKGFDDDLPESKSIYLGANIAL